MTIGDGGVLPYKKKAKRINKSKCQHDFVETKRYAFTYLYHGEVNVQVNIVYKCTKCKKRKQELFVKKGQ